MINSQERRGKSWKLSNMALCNANPATACRCAPCELWAPVHWICASVACGRADAMYEVRRYFGQSLACNLFKRCSKALLRLGLQTEWQSCSTLRGLLAQIVIPRGPVWMLPVIAYQSCSLHSAARQVGFGGPWDCAAGALVVLEAGGQVTDVAGGPFDLMARRVLATNAHLTDAGGGGAQDTAARARASRGLQPVG